MYLSPLNLFNNHIKIFVAFIAALIVSLVLFYIMNFMVNSDNKGSKYVNNNYLISFIRVKQDSESQQKKRLIIKEKIKYKPAPEKPKISITKKSIKQNINPIMTIPKLKSLALQGSPTIGEIINLQGEGGLIPVTRIAPQYPIKAARKKIEGWVKVEFSVLDNGSVFNIKVIESKPKRIFNRAAIKAISKWKFKPMGKSNLSVKRFNQLIEFKLK